MSAISTCPLFPALCWVLCNSASSKLKAETKREGNRRCYCREPHNGGHGNLTAHNVASKNLSDLKLLYITSRLFPMNNKLQFIELCYLFTCYCHCYYCSCTFLSLLLFYIAGFVENWVSFIVFFFFFSEIVLCVFMLYFAVALICLLPSRLSGL